MTGSRATSALAEPIEAGGGVIEPRYL